MVDGTLLDIIGRPSGRGSIDWELRWPIRELEKLRKHLEDENARPH